MNTQVLVSTMNIKSEKEYINKINSMNLNERNSIFINQCPGVEEINIINCEYKLSKLYSYNEKGLSKSRNRAINNSNSDICIIADDDLEYENDYEKTILDAYKKYCDADIIAFFVENAKKRNSIKEGKVDFFHAFKICSVQITFKRKKIIDNKIQFDSLFGSGSNYFIHGEENIFLTDCIKKGLKVYYVPQKIATLKSSESSWFKGYNDSYLEATGAQFYRMNKILCFPFLIQFLIRKRHLYKNNFTFINALK